jgi:hypothetical protein
MGNPAAKQMLLQKFNKKSPSKTFLQINRQVFPCRFLLLFLFYRVCGCFSATGVQKHHKSVSQKGRVEKLLQKNRQNIQSLAIAGIFCFVITFLGVSRRGEFENAIKKQKMFGPVTFFASDLPTHAAATGSPIIYCLPQQHHGTAREAHYYRHQEAARKSLGLEMLSAAASNPQPPSSKQQHRAPSPKGWGPAGCSRADIQLSSVINAKGRFFGLLFTYPHSPAPATDIAHGPPRSLPAAHRFPSPGANNGPSPVSHHEPRAPCQPSQPTQPGP